MNAVKHCQARQYSDQMMCPRCGLQWDVNDPDPPECKKDQPKPRVALRDRNTTNRTNDNKE